jgi:hypothetical protein
MSASAAAIATPLDGFTDAAPAEGSSAANSASATATASSQGGSAKRKAGAAAQDDDGLAALNLVRDELLFELELLRSELRDLEMELQQLNVLLRRAEEEKLLEHRMNNLNL